MRTLRKVLLAALGAAALAAGGFYSWRWYTTPPLPPVPLDGVDPLVRETVERARQEVANQPRSGAAWGKLAMVLAANGFPEPALDCYAHAERFDRDNPAWPYLRGVLLLTREPAHGIACLRKALALARKRDERIAILFRLVVALIKERQLDDAAPLLEQLERADANSPFTQYAFALDAVARDDHPKARDRLLRIVRNPLFRKRACFLLAAVSDEPEQADAYRRLSDQLPPDSSWPDPFTEEENRSQVKRMARIQEFFDLESSGQHTQALALLKRYVAEAPDAEVCLILGVALYHTREYRDAVAALRAATTFEPKNGEAHYYLGAATLREGERMKSDKSKEAADLFRQAIDAEDRAIALEANLGDAWNVRGLALKHLGQRDEAIQAFREANLVTPHVTGILINLGETLAEAGRWEEAKIHLERAVRLAAPGDQQPQTVLKKWQTKYEAKPKP